MRPESLRDTAGSSRNGGDIVKLAERLDHYSHGTMKIRIYSGGQLGSERELIELLQIGALALTKVSAAPLEGFVPVMKVFRQFVEDGLVD